MRPAINAQNWPRLSAQLDELLDLPEHERAARLDALRAKDAPAADALVQLLAPARSTGIERLLGGQALGAEPPTLAGQRLGAYTLDAPLGQGGGGAVWRARRHDGRYSGEVAVKLLHLSLMGRAAAERFQREGEILARLTHPHIARLLDFGIAKLAEEGSCSAEATALTREAGRVLTPRYAAPEQLRGDAVTTATDGYGLGLLLYQLLAERLPERAADQTSEFTPPPPSHAATGAALQRALRGDLDTIVLRAIKPAAAERYPTVSAMQDDIRRYLDGRTVLAQPDSWTYRTRKLVLRHKAGSAIVAAVALALLGGAYAQVAVLVALAVGAAVALWQAASARREAAAARAAQQQAEEVKQFIASIFTEAKPREGAGGVVTAADLLRSATERIEAELAANPAVAAELGVLVAESCSHLGDLGMGERAAQAAWPRCVQAFGSRHPTTLRARFCIVEAANNHGRYDEAVVAANALVADLREALPAQASLLVSALRAVSFAQAKFQRRPESFAALHEAVAMAEQHLGPLHEQTLDVLGFLSNTHMHFGERAQALEVSEQAMRRARQAFGAQRPHTQLVSPERWYATALVARGRPAEAEPLARQVVADQRLLDGGPSLRVVQAMTVHSQALAALGRTREAVALSLQVAEEHERLMPVNHGDNAIFAERVALQLLPTRRAGEIEHGLARSAAIHAAAVGAEPEALRLRRVRVRATVGSWRGDEPAGLAELLALPTNASTMLAHQRVLAEQAWAAHWRWQGRPLDAVKAAQRAAEGAQADTFTDGERASIHTELALAWLAAGDMPQARASAQQALGLFESGQVEPSLLRADHDLVQGRLHLLAADAVAAEQALARAEQHWQAEHPGSVWHAEVMHWLAQALRVQGRAAEAELLGRRGHPVLAAAPLPALRALAGADAAPP